MTEETMLQNKPLKKNWPLITLAILLAVSLIFSVILAYQNSQLRKLAKEEKVPEQSRFDTSFPAASDKEKPDSLPVIIYTEEVSSEQADNRSWPTVKIMRKVGDQPAEELVVVGKVGESPRSFVLSHDKQKLLVNLGSKLQLFDLNTGKLEDLFVLEKGDNYEGVVFSPDDSRLFIWDQKYASNDREYFVHIFELRTRQDRITKQGILVDDHPSTLLPNAWRNDDKLVMTEPMGESAALWFYDLASNAYQKTPGDFSPWPISLNGMVAGVPKFTVVDSCNAKHGSATGSYDLINPINGSLLGKMGNDQKVVQIIAFSVDAKKVLYQTSDLIPSYPADSISIDEWFTKCEELYKKQKETSLYYQKTIGVDGSEAPVADPKEVLSMWDARKTGAEQKSYYSQEERQVYKYSIIFDQKEIVSSQNPLRIVAEYWQ